MISDLLTGIPSETVTGIVGLIGGTITKLAAQKAAQQQQMMEMLAQKAQLRETAAEAASKRGGSGGEWVRRGIAIMVGIYLFGVPIIAALSQLGGNFITTTYLYNKSSAGFWIFKGASEDLYHALVSGYVITPLHTHLSVLVLGYYFGAGVIKSR